MPRVSDSTGASDVTSATGDARIAELYASGFAALDRGAFDEARGWAERCRAATDAASDARCAALEGAIAADTGDETSAATHFRRVVEQAPADAQLCRDLAEILVTRGALDEAVGVLEKASARHASDANLLVDLGYVHVIRGDETAARAALQRASAVGPSDATVARHVAQAYERLGAPADAIAALAVASHAAPSPRILTHLARLCLRLDRHADAETAFVTLRKIDPEHAVFAHHGQTWCRLKRKDWRGALDAALSTTRLDRFDLTTAFLAYARDRLFGTEPDPERQERDLAERFFAELDDHEELHAEDIATPSDPGARQEETRG